MELVNAALDQGLSLGLEEHAAEENRAAFN